MLPKLTDAGELPPGVHAADWREFESRFGGSSLRRVWLLGRLRSLIELAATSGQLRRCFVWGSFVTAKPAPGDLDVLLIMSEEFEVDRLTSPAQDAFDATLAKLRFEADVFRARASISHDALDLWLDTYQVSRSFSKTRYCGIGVAVIQIDDEMLLAQQCVANLRRVLLEARKVHPRRDYTRMTEPILLEIQQREQEILEYLTRDLEHQVTS